MIITINHIISECSKLAQREYKIRQDWVGMVIHWELCKKFKFSIRKMIYALPRMYPRKWDGQNSLRFWDINGSSNQQSNQRNSGICHSGWPQSKSEGTQKER